MRLRLILCSNMQTCIVYYAMHFIMKHVFIMEEVSICEGSIKKANLYSQAYKNVSTHIESRIYNNKKFAEGLAYDVE